MCQNKNIEMIFGVKNLFLIKFFSKLSVFMLLTVYISYVLHIISNTLFRFQIVTGSDTRTLCSGI